MIKLRQVFTPDRGNYGGDILRVQRVIIERGYECNLSQAQAVWEAFSESMCAGWMGLPDTDDGVWGCCAGVIENDDD